MAITLEAARVNAGFTQKDAAKSLGVTVQTLVNWEKGRSEPSISQARKIAKMYKMELSNIYFSSIKSN